MRKRIGKYFLISMVTSWVAANTYAVGSGFYMGVMMGPATNSGGDQQAQVDNPTALELTPATPRSNQFGARVFMGNQFSQYAAIEGGLTFISKIKYDTKGVETCTGVSERVRSFDIVGKGIMPLGPYFDIFGKVGAAATYLTTSGALDPAFDITTNPEDPITCGKNTYKNKFSPVFAIGASYNLNQNWVTDLSYTTLQVGGKVSSVSMIALAISYHFVNKYCGQFLCDD
ncbi:MAG: outer membrane beta-barrel protein [Gammaproteobacteria bacterium]|nr:outer membrane beta-barrel protein [Gammaproteobacteria bacterium]MCW5584288.1 outer membrane beta-barrel protein [Gammaproteobacteria bacterium]